VQKGVEAVGIYVTIFSKLEALFKGEGVIFGATDGAEVI